MPPLYDAHNHLQDDWLTPHRPRIWADLAQIGLRGAVVNGTSEQDWPEVERLVADRDELRPSYGLHPWQVGQRTSQWRERLQRHWDRAPTGAVGEIGLDQWILKRARPDDPRLAGLRRAGLAEQTEVFVWQLEQAAQRNWPATIHCLEAWGALLEILETALLPARGFLLHAYNGSRELLPRLAARGAYFSFNASFLDPRHERLHAVFRAVPVDRLLVETDAPAMPPPPAWRPFSLPPGEEGRPVNHPANLAAAYAGLAALRGCEEAALAARVEENFQRLFG